MFGPKNIQDELVELDLINSKASAALARLSKLKVELDALRAVAIRAAALPHNRAPYEGDGDPGCFSNCLACMAEDALKLGHR